VVTPSVSRAEAMPRPGLRGRALARMANLLKRSGVSPAMVTGAGWSIAGTVAGVAASFIAQVILARALAPTRYGVYSYLLAWVNVAVLVGKLEFDTAAVRFVGAYGGKGQYGLLHGFLRDGLRVVAATATGAALVAGLGAWLLRSHLPSGTAQAVLAACVLVPLSALLLFSGSVLQGLRRVPQAQLPGQLLRPALFGGGVLLAGSGFGLGVGASGAIAINAGATAVALGVSLLLLRSAIPATVVAAAPVFDRAMWMRTVRGFMVISAAQLVLSQQADILVVGTLLSPRDAGLYSAASQLSTLIGLGATAIIFVVLPVVSELHAQGRTAELQHLVVRTVQASAAVSVPAALLLAAAGRLALHSYGSGFVGAYPILLVLSGVQLVIATIGALAGYLLTMTGHEGKASRVVVGTALLNLALTVVLTPLLGAVGAALATMAAGLIRAGIFWSYARRHVGVAILPYMPAERPVVARP
jgi:O-antigen/teichoic acid export membrane protein